VFVLALVVFTAVFTGLHSLMLVLFPTRGPARTVADWTLTASILLLTLWMAFVGWKRLFQAASAWLYRNEGEIEVGRPEVRRPPRWELALWFLAVFVPSAAFGFLEVDRLYLQPLWAVWLVPMAIALWLRHRPNVSPILLLWPALFALHAVLIVCRAPIVFTGDLEGLNLLIPAFGYGLLTGLIALAYSRYALTRLRRLAQAAGNEGR
jgi:hypothetical protein